MSAPATNCTAKHASGLVCAMQWHTGPHKAAVFDHGEPFIYEWNDEKGELYEFDVAQLGLYAPGKAPCREDAESAEWKPGEFAGKQLFPGARSKRYTIRNDVAESLGIVHVCDDGLVTIYCGANGTFGWWPTPHGFRDDGIIAFLATCEPGYIADKFTKDLPDGKMKRVAQHHLVEMWPFVVTSLKKSMEVAP